MRRASGQFPAKEWFDGLSKKGIGQFYAAAMALETSFRSGRSPAGRAEKVSRSQAGLWELKVTKPGSSAPHLRLLYLRQGQIFWAANGFTKQSNQLEEKDIRTGDAIAMEWFEAGKK